MTKIITAARACVVHEEKLLLVKGDDSPWHLPGGLMDPHEGLAVCAKREVYEETGYEVAIGDLLYVYEFYDKRWDSHKVECIFRATIDAHPSTHEWEDLGHDKSIIMKEWFSLEEIQALEDLVPEFLREGKWLKEPKNGVYMGYKKPGT